MIANNSLGFRLLLSCSYRFRVYRAKQYIARLDKNLDSSFLERRKLEGLIKQYKTVLGRIRGDNYAKIARKIGVCDSRPRQLFHKAMRDLDTFNKRNV